MVSPARVGCTPMTFWGRADLHTHTDASDGWPTPSQLVEHATLRAGLDVMAGTDHHTIEGAPRAPADGPRRTKPHVVGGGGGSGRDRHTLGFFPPARR